MAPPKASIVRHQTDAIDHASLLASVTAVLISLYRDATVLFQTPYPVGVDGYYYATQVRELIRANHLHYSSLSLSFHLIALCCPYSDPVTCIKIFTLACYAFFLIGIVVLIYQLTHDRPLSALSLIVCAFLPSHGFLLAEFTKELVALTLLIWSAIALMNGYLTRTKAWFFIGAFGTILSFCTHKSAALIVGLCALSSFAYLKLGRSSISLACIIGTAWIITFLISLPRISGYLGPGITLAPQTLYVTWWTLERVLLLLLSVLAFVPTFLRTGLEVPDIVFGGISLVIISVSANPLLDQNSDHIFGRLALMANIQVAFLIAGLGSSLKGTRRAYAPIFVVTGCLLLLACIAKLPSIGTDRVFLERRAELVSALKSGSVELDSSALVIAPHGDEFTITYVLNVAASSHWAFDERRTIYWLLDIASADENLPSKLSVKARNSNRILIRDSDLRSAWRFKSKGAKNMLIRYNPELVSAGYYDE